MHGQAECVRLCNAFNKLVVSLDFKIMNILLDYGASLAARSGVNDTLMLNEGGDCLNLVVKQTERRIR